MVVWDEKSWSNCISSILTVIISLLAWITVIRCRERRNFFRTQGRDLFHSYLEHVELGASIADTSGVVAGDLYNKEFQCFATFWKHICLVIIIKTLT